MSGYQEWRLLLIDDDEDDYILTRSMLDRLQGRKVMLDWAAGYEDGCQRMGSKTYDAVLVDYDLGLRTGIELIREFVTQEYPAPLILYTGRGSFEVDVEAMQAGATLYLTKGETSPLLMERSIRYAIERKQIEDELRASNERLVTNADQLAHELAERKRVEKMLETAHAEVLNEKNRLLAVMETLPVGVAILDAKGGSLHTNRYYERIWGSQRPGVHTIDDYAPYKAWWVDSGKPVLPEEWASAQAIRKGETVVGQSLQIERFDGTRRFVLNSGAPILDAQGHIIGSAVAIMDITEHKQAEEQLRALNRSLRALINSNQALMRATSEAEFLQAVCKIVVEDCGHAMAWIGYAEQDEGKNIRPVACAGCKQGDLEAMSVSALASWADNERGWGPTGEAIRTGQVSLRRKMANETETGPAAFQRGCASSIALPLTAEGRALGALTIYSRDADPFSKDEVRLLTELASDLSYGIGALRLRAAKAQAEDELRRQREWLSVTLTSIGDGVIAADPEGRVTFLNPAATALTGWSQEEALGLPVQQVFPIINEKTRQVAEDVVFRALKEKRAVALANHTALVNKVGVEIPIEDSAAPILDAQGETVGVVLVFHDVTEKRRAQAALRASEERLSLAIEGAGMATWDVDLHSGEAVWSRRHFELLGYTSPPGGQATLEMWRSRIHPDDLDRVQAAYEKAQREHSLYCPHHRIVRADNGQIVWLRVFGRFSYDDAGQPRRFTGVLFDDTPFQEASRFIEARPPARQRAALAPREEDLRQLGIDVVGAAPWGTHFCQFYATSQDLVETLVPYFRAGLEANEFCMWVTSAPLQVDQARDALRKSLPDLDSYLARGQIEILDYSQWYTPAGRFDADQVLQGWTDKLAAARQKGFEGLRLTGNTFWLEQTDWEDFTRYEEKINQIIGGQRMLALCTYSLEKCGVREIMDVVANHQFALIKNAGRWEIFESAGHVKMEQVLRESEERLRLAIWAAELGVFEWDALNDHAVWENRRMYEIFGHTIQEGALTKAQLLENVIHPDDVEAFQAALEEGMRPGRLFHAICRIRRRNDGALRWVEFSGRFEQNMRGIKPLDSGPLLSGTHLSGVLADITERKRVEDALKVQNERLQSYAEQLKRSNQDLEDFAFIACHDLKEPLRKVQAFGDLLRSRHSRGLKTEGQMYVERMQQASSRMQNMLDGLLEYSRVTTQGRPFLSVDLSEIAREALSDLEARLMQTAGQVEVGPLAVIQADPLQMRQLLQNLIGNALKFHRPGVPPCVTVYSKAISEDWIALTVEDNGIGFDEQYVDRLFKPFHRVHAKQEYEGTGLGLAICNKIAERHGGSICAKSVPGQGSIFTVILPVNQAVPAYEV